ncbi:MAG: YciI family protein [Actinomycetota bacterium]
MLLIYENEGEWDRMGEDDRNQSFGSHIGFANRLRAEGRFVWGDALSPSVTATCVRIENGRRSISDGPYAETREQMGGFYLIEAEDLDQALADAGDLPSRPGQIVEVRPVLDLTR